MVRPPKRFEPARHADPDRSDRRDGPEFVKGRRASSPFLDEQERDDWVPGVGPHYDESVFESKYAVRSVGHHIGPEGPVASPASDGVEDHVPGDAGRLDHLDAADDVDTDDVEVDLRDDDRPALTFYQRRSAHLPRLEDARRAAEEEDAGTPADPFSRDRGAESGD